MEISGFRFDRMHGPQVDSSFVCMYLGRASVWDRAVALVNTLMLCVLVMIFVDRDMKGVFYATVLLRRLVELVMTGMVRLCASR